MATTALNINFQIGSAGTETTLVTTLSDKVSSCDFSQTQDLPDATAFNGNGARSFVVGLREGEFAMEFFWDATVDAHLNGLFGNQTPVNYQYGPDGSSTGKRKYTGTLFVMNVSTPATVGDIKKVNATFKLNGAPTATTFA